MPSSSTRSSHSGSKSPAIRGRAEVRDPVAHALLVREGGDLDGKRKPLAALRESLDGGERDEHAERAVEAAGVGHGVEVGAEHERRAGVATRRRVAADDVPRGVPARLHPGGLHPGRDELAGPPEGRCREPARQPARLLADLAERRGAREDPGGGARHDAGR